MCQSAHPPFFFVQTHPEEPDLTDVVGLGAEQKNSEKLGRFDLYDYLCKRKIEAYEH